MKRLALLLLLASLSACAIFDGDDDTPIAPPPVVAFAPSDPAAWEIGPIIDGENISLHMPPHPSPHPEGWVIEMPHPTQDAGSVHYVTTRTPPLAGAKRIVLEFRVEGGRFVPRNYPDSTASLTLYIERAGMRWTSTYEAFRWYAKFAQVRPLAAGVYRVEAPLDGNWTAALTSSREDNPEAFDAALRETRRVGFVLGGGDGVGHGVYATGPARIVVLLFRVE
jgi:hypothetical protein